MPFFGKGYDGLADCYHPKGLECLKGYSIFSIHTSVPLKRDDY